MKKCIITIIAVLFCFLGSNMLFAATNTWTQKADFGGVERSKSVGFSIGSKGYIGTGWDGSYSFRKDFWEYDPASNTWTQKADFAGEGRHSAVGFAIGSKGYIGTGTVSTKDFWEYDPTAKAWTQKADFGGEARNNAVRYSIGSKGYIGTGFDNSSYMKDFWEYDPAANTWTQKADFGGTARQNAVGFSIGSKGYIGIGRDDSSKRDFWEYDPALNTWTQKADFGGTGQIAPVGFSIGNKGYIGTGVNGSYSLTKDFWEYDPALNTWTRKADFAGTARFFAVGFSIGSKGYIGTGNVGPNTKDFWEYDSGSFFFTDVPPSYWAYVYIMAIYNAGYTTGSGVGTFSPEGPVTREQMAAFIIRAKDGEPPTDYCSAGPPFPDCSTDSWSCKYIKRLSELGLTTGYGNTGLYMPAYNVTRAQMAAFLVRAVEGEPAANYCSSSVPFTDVTASDWSCIYIKRLYELNITTGYGDGRYGPDDLVTRAQMAVFLARAFLTGK